MKRKARRADSPAVVYRDTLLRVMLVVEHGGQLWLVPRRHGGWANRQRLTMTDAARSERLRPARDVDAGWLGIGSENGPPGIAPGRPRTANHDLRPVPRLDASNERIGVVRDSGESWRERAGRKTEAGPVDGGLIGR